MCTWFCDLFTHSISLNLIKYLVTIIKTKLYACILGMKQKIRITTSLWLSQYWLWLVWDTLIVYMLLAVLLVCFIPIYWSQFYIIVNSTSYLIWKTILRYNLGLWEIVKEMFHSFMTLWHFIDQEIVYCRTTTYLIVLGGILRQINYNYVRAHYLNVTFNQATTLKSSWHLPGWATVLARKRGSMEIRLTIDDQQRFRCSWKFSAKPVDHFSGSSSFLCRKCADIWWLITFCRVKGLPQTER